MVVIIGRKIGCKEKSKLSASAYVGKSSNIPVYWLAFTATVQPLDFSTCVISSGKLAASVKQISYPFDGSQRSDVQVVRSGNLKLVYSGNDGKLMQYINSGRPASGAYIFHPNGTFPIQSEGKIPLAVFRGPLFDEVHQTFNSWTSQITRVNKEKERVEIEFMIGDYRADWDLQVNQPIAGNYYPVCFLKYLPENIDLVYLK